MAAKTPETRAKTPETPVIASDRLNGLLKARADGALADYLTQYPAQPLVVDNPLGAIFKMQGFLEQELKLRQLIEMHATVLEYLAEEIHKGEPVFWREFFTQHAEKLRELAKEVK